MTERITPRQFHEAVGVEDWRVLFEGACAHFRTGSFATGVELVDVIGKLADAANHHPDVDLRYSGVTVRLSTHDVDGLSERDVELARQISAAAHALGVPADPTAVQTVQPRMPRPEAGARPPLTVVDAANVVGARPDGWWKDRAGATRRLLDALARVAAGDEEVILVVEGAARAGVPAGDVGRVRVVHAARSGDDAIVAIVRDAKAADSSRPVSVVTADRELRERVREAGAEVIGPRTLWSRLETRANS
jgi:pterin-4a-carbinolamine dehydratase/predicted RNA-binding protein with PIN domain